jgi:hypothetical protein
VRALTACNVFTVARVKGTEIFLNTKSPLGKKLIKKQLEQRHRARCTACTGCRQSNVLMRYPLPSRANELLAMSKLRLRAAVGLTGHASLRAHLHKLGHTERQECRLCGYEKQDSVHIVCDCLVLQRIQDLGLHVSKPGKREPSG